MIKHEKLMVSQGKFVKGRGRAAGKTVYNQKTVHLITGTCARDFSEYVEQKHVNINYATSFQAHENDEKWDFSAGYNGVAELCKTGWIPGTQSVCDFSDKIRENIKKNSSYRRDTSGLFYDIADAIAGVPECYFKKDNVKQTKEIQININITGSYKVPASLLHNRGAAILALIQSLQAEKWNVKLSLFSCFLNYSIADDGKNRGYCVQRIDLDTKPLDVSELSLILAHPGFMRRIGFAVSETSEQVYSLGAYGGGTLTKYCSNLSDFSSADIENIIDTCKPKTCENTLNFMEYVLDTDIQFNTPKSAGVWVQSQLDSLKI
jgi:hypothetical protein